MKKLIVALALFAAFGVSAQSKPAKTQGALLETPAQDSNEAKAAKNVADLGAAITLNADQKAIFQELFTTKYRMLNESGQELSQARKEHVASLIDKKLEATLDGNSYEKVKANKTLHYNLTH